MSHSPAIESDRLGRNWHPETANQLTHGLGFCLSLAAATVLLSTVVQTGDPWRIAGCCVYGLSLVALYAASTLSHSFESGPRREFYRMLDQVCIFLLMVGNYTPFAVVYMRDGGWWIIPVLMWIAAIYGIITRIRTRSKTIAILPFILLGWLPVIGINRMIEVGSVGGMALIVAGGLAYTGGAWFLANDHRKPYFHATWHMATITGSACHYFFVLEYIARTPLA